MADHKSEPESLIEKITEKIHDSSSSSDSESEPVKSKIYRLFGRERPVHKVLGGGKRTHTLSLSLHTHTHKSMIRLVDEKV
jgi:hypothetical protein